MSLRKPLVKKQKDDGCFSCCGLFGSTKKKSGIERFWNKDNVQRDQKNHLAKAGRLHEKQEQRRLNALSTSTSRPKQPTDINLPMPKEGDFIKFEDAPRLSSSATSEIVAGSKEALKNVSHQLSSSKTPNRRGP